MLLNEFDYVESGAAVEEFRTNYLAVGHNGAEPIDYPFYYIAPTNTGVPSGLAVLRLSSKSHWDLPDYVGDRVVHVLAAHPTPPVFDGPEDRNGLRNADEIRFWADYVAGPTPPGSSMTPA